MPTCRTPPLAPHTEPTAWARPNTRWKSPSLTWCSSIHPLLVDNQVGAPFPAPHRPILRVNDRAGAAEATLEEDACGAQDRKSTRLNSSHVRISYAVFCLKKKNKTYQYMYRSIAASRVNRI